MENEVVDDKSLNETLDDSIRETLKEITDRNGELPKEEISDESTKPRDETGKFVKEEKKAPVSEKPVATEPAEPQPTETEAPLVTTTGQPIDINRAPASWKPAAKAIWAGLPEPVRAEVYRRESDFLNGNKGLKENADFGQNVQKIAEPYRLLIEAEGSTIEKAIESTLRASATFRVGTPQQKLNTWLEIAKNFNVPVQDWLRGLQVQPGQVPQQPQTFQDPRVDQLMASMQTQERERAAQIERSSNDAAEKFISAIDDKGQPLYPFVDNVLDDMTERVRSLSKANPGLSHQDILKQAYDAAVWAHPETRAVLIGQQQAQAQKPAETLRKTEQAKRASATNVPKRGALPSTGPAKTLEETIRETGRELGMF